MRQILADRLNISSDARRLVQWLDGDRQRYDDLVDVALSVAETASLTSFQHDGGKWQFDIVGEHSAEGCALTAAMHHLRALLLVRPYLQSSIYRATIPADLKQALATLVLSHDAAPAHIQPALTITAGLGRTGDPVGDAQLAAEELFATHDLLPTGGSGRCLGHGPSAFSEDDPVWGWARCCLDDHRAWGRLSQLKPRVSCLVNVDNHLKIRKSHSQEG